MSYDLVPTQAGKKAQAIAFKLAKKSKLGGVIIQSITKTDQSGNQIGSKFWEAFPVGANSKYTIFHGTLGNGTVNIDDLFAEPNSGVTVKASASFYEGLATPDTFKSRNPDTSAGQLRSTTQDPGLSGGTAPVNRTWTSP